MIDAPTRPILRYHGGKWILAPWIISHFPEHRVYCEPFGGAASVLLRKQRSYAEVYNDLDDDIVNLFQMARDQGDELNRRLFLTPFARVDYDAAWTISEDPMQRACNTVIRSFMGFGSAAATLMGNRGRTGFRANSNRSGTTPAHDWANYSGSKTGFRDYTGTNRQTLPVQDWDNFAGCLPLVVERLRGVVIEHRDAKQVMAAHDGIETLHYVDPPYTQETRDAGSDYRHEMTTDDHRELAAFLRTLKGFVIVSGYDCDLYEELFAGWRTVRKAALADGARKRTETLWLSPNVLSHGDLFTSNNK